MTKTEIVNQAAGDIYSANFGAGLEGIVASMREADKVANVDVVDMVDHGLVARRDALGVASIVFEEAQRSLFAGEESDYFTVIGNNVLGKMREDDATKARNFIYELNAYHGADYLSEPEKRVVAEIMESDLNNPANVGKYAIVRADIRERYIKQEFGSEFASAREGTAQFLEETLTSFGFDAADVEAAAKRVRKTKLAAQDYLERPVTGSADPAINILGDYVPGSLRAHIYLRGSARHPRTPAPAEARKTMIHELMHAGSAQPTEVIVPEDGSVPVFITHRTGLMSRYGDFLPINEGLTEFLARLANGEEIVTNGSRSYDKEVAGVAHLASEKPELFGALISSAFSPQLHGDLSRAIQAYVEYQLVA